MNTRNKYVTAVDIYMRIISTFKSKAAEISKIEVVRWCSEVITDYLKDPVGLVAHKKYCVVDGVAPKVITNGMATLPTDIFKLEGVYNEVNGFATNFTYQGDYLIFSDDYMPEKVYIDYYSLPVDEVTGYPLIKKGYEPACYAYCVYKMFEEDATAIPPRVAQWRWLQIVQDKEWEIEAAHRSWDGITDNDLMELHNYIISRDYLEQVYGIQAPMLDGGSMYGGNEQL
jgi:hypothetical protein